MTRSDSLTLKQLRAIDAVSRYGSITKASEELGLTVPAVHSQIKTIETNFGCALLSRDGSGLFTLTAEGQELGTAFDKIRASLDLALLRIDALRRGHAGTVVLGVVSTGKYFAPGLVALLRKAVPDIEVILRVGNRTEIVAALGDGSIDLAIMGRPPREPENEALVIGDHPHLLIAPPGHGLDEAGTASPLALLDQTVILREPGSGTRIMAVRYFDRIGEGQTYRTTQMDSNETIKQAVIAGLGIALISAHTVTEELRSGRLVKVRADGLPLIRHWFLLHRRDVALTGAVRTVHSFIASRKGDFLPRRG